MIILDEPTSGLDRLLNAKDQSGNLTFSLRVTDYIKNKINLLVFNEYYMEIMLSIVNNLIIKSWSFLYNFSRFPIGVITKHVFYDI